MKSSTLLLSLVLATGLLSGCVTHITTNVTQNPPPTEKLSDFTRFQLDPITLPRPYAGQAANEKARAKIQQDVSKRMDPLIAEWNRAAPAAAPGRTLEIEPAISEIKFINGMSRFWAGPMAGSSAVIMKVRLVDRANNRVVAEPMFFARAAAWGGSFTIGATDNLMLMRIANRLCDYLSANYAQAVGGPTGALPPK